MKKFAYYVGSSALFLLPLVSSAQFQGNNLQSLATSVMTFINGVLVPLVIALGFLFFVWGMFNFFIAGSSNEENREKGKQVMIYSILAFVLIVAFWGIINLLVGSLGLTNTVPTVTTPR